MLRSFLFLAFFASLFLGCSYVNVSDEDDFDNALKYNNNHEKFIVDNRDGRMYKYVTIGSQTWLAENLKYKAPNSRCYDDNPYKCEIFGVLYDWETAKDICPHGWHLPSDAEWFTLRNSAGSNADTKLMANSAFWFSIKGTDDFGFAALPGGYYRHESYFLNIGTEAVFWSATAGTSEGSAHVHFITPRSWVREVDGLYTNNSWVNVRCVK
jgi:uncharacterized protein (TIGR02145 family)